MAHILSREGAIFRFANIYMVFRKIRNCQSCKLVHLEKATYACPARLIFFMLTTNASIVALVLYVLCLQRPLLMGIDVERDIQYHSELFANYVVQAIRSLRAFFGI